MKKNPTPQEKEQDRVAALRQQQIENIQEDIRMHEETGERSPVEGEVEHLNELRSEDEPDKEVKPKKKG